MPAPSMPPLTGELHRRASYYRVAWLRDGYPGRRAGRAVVVHPLYGAYALKDYLDQLAAHPTEELRAALRRVAGAVVGRMQTYEDALVFWYEPDETNARSLERHYSALTQAYYAAYLAQAGLALDDQALLEAAHAVFAAVKVPVSRGGVLSRGVRGPSIAQVPQQPRSHVLNGWQSALVAIGAYANLTGQSDARELLHDSTREMARLLPLYDVPELRNSRYGLSGFVYARLVFRMSEPASVAVRGIRVAIPGEGRLPVDRIGGGRWQNHVLPQDVPDPDPRPLRPLGNVLRLNLVLSRACHPRVNRLLCKVTGPAGAVEVQVQRGRYDPLTVSQVDRNWVTIARVPCEPGTTGIDAPLPWDVVDLVAYPTNFAKRIEKKQTNVYHPTHVHRLWELSAATGVPDLAAWADTWLGYLREWPAMPIYQGLHLQWDEQIVPVAEAGQALPTSMDPLAGTLGPELEVSAPGVRWVACRRGRVQPVG